ncbi:MAG: type II secretion system F family protein [Gaiellaceae bacterium]
MAGFSYTAISIEGVESVGEIHAPDLAAAREQLHVRGLLPQSLRELPSAGQEGLGSTFKKIKPRSMQIFSRQFATMIEAGLNIVAALVILEEQTDDPYLAEVIAELRADVEGGLLLSQAMSRHPKVFNELYVSMVQAGEASGMLDQVLDRVAEQIEKETKLKRRVKGAMVYPTVVFTFASLVLVAMLMFIVPIFARIFTSLHGQLPLLTRIVVKASDLLRERWYIIFPLIAFLIWGGLRYKNSESGRPKWDAFKLRIPLKIGDVVLKVTMARLLRTLATLVAAGVDIIKALDIAGSTAGNWVVERALAETRIKVQEGVPIAEPLTADPTFPPMVSQMIRIGEETGELEQMLSKIADFYEDEVDAAVQSLTSIIEPLMMIGVGFMVGIIIISMYLPMFKLMQLIGNQQ